MHCAGIGQDMIAELTMGAPGVCQLRVLPDGKRLRNGTKWHLAHVLRYSRWHGPRIDYADTMAITAATHGNIGFERKTAPSWRGGQ